MNADILHKPNVVIDRMGRQRTWPSPMERLTSRLSITAAGCMEFTGYRNHHGYGQIGIHRTQYLTHRLMWIAQRGAIPPGMLVCHRCDNPPCCNIDHLFLGTAQDNTDDMVRKSRGRALSNEANPRSRLSRDEVAEIRRARAAGESCESLAARYGVSSPHISRVSRGLRRQLA